MPTEAKAQDPVSDNTSTDGQASEGIKLTPELQKFFNQKMEERLDRHGREMKEKLDKVQAERDLVLQEMEELRKSRKPETNEEGKVKTAEELLAEMEELRKAHKRVLDEKDEIQRKSLSAKEQEQQTLSKMIELRKEHRMQQAIAKFPFVDPNEVLELTKKNFRYDKDKDTFYIVSDSGAPMTNATLDPMTDEEFYTQYGQAKKHHVRSDIVGGFGSTESKSSGIPKGYALEDLFGKNSDWRKTQALLKSDPAKYDAMRKEAKEKGII